MVHLNPLGPRNVFCDSSDKILSVYMEMYSLKTNHYIISSAVQTCLLIALSLSVLIGCSQGLCLAMWCETELIIAREDDNVFWKELML